MIKSMKTLPLLTVLVLHWGTAAVGEDQEKPLAVIDVGTLHHSPELSMQLSAKELERFGFRTANHSFCGRSHAR